MEGEQRPPELCQLKKLLKTQLYREHLDFFSPLLPPYICSGCCTACLGVLLGKNVSLASAVRLHQEPEWYENNMKTGC